MDVQIGGHLYRNTDGTVEVEGVPQLTVALKTPDGPLSVSVVLFDPVGRVLAKVVDSTMAFNERRAYELTKTPTGLLLKNGENGKVILDVLIAQPNRVVVKQAELTTIKGHTLEISATDWKVDKSRSASGESDLTGGSVPLG